MKKLLKYLAVAIGGGLMMIFIAYLGLIGWLQWTLSHPSPSDVFPLAGQQTTQTQVLRYQVGSRRFNIPVNYIFKKPGRLRTDIIKTPTPDGIWVLWPDLKPYTKETRAEFDQLGRGNKIDFMITGMTGKWYQPPNGKFDPSILDPNQEVGDRGGFIPEYQFFHDIYALKQEGIEGSYNHDPRIPSEFIYYQQWKGATGEVSEKKSLQNIYAILENGRYVYSAKCRGSEFAPSPSCNNYFKYSDDIYVDYTFSLDLLKDWRQIESKIRELVASFERAAATEKP
ncbi:MAG: hypothetical protein PHH59_00080 [Methylovulum sp.]|uniref:hypothetical protein n=1 Tax=Methylovulum sp. TaxID=1916980 RepID=UPI002637FD72|nr:hypothetical protein [Methylovulum sp.]MDD2722405.1 hypothetical protein [Methylovulum sp.]